MPQNTPEAINLHLDFQKKSGGETPGPMFVGGYPRSPIRPSGAGGLALLCVHAICSIVE